MVINESISQGDILKIENIQKSVLVVSKNTFNKSGKIIGCPINTDSTASALHIEVQTEKTNGYVYCENMTLLDMTIRRYSIKDHIHMPDIIDITDAIQSIFDYI